MYPANLIWGVARKPSESDADEYTQIRDPFRTTHAGLEPMLYSPQSESGCDNPELDEAGSASDGARDTAPEDS